MAKKNGNGEGNIRQRKDGRYEARYCVEMPEGLKRRSVYGTTRKEVAEKLAEKLANKGDEPTRLALTGITVQEFFGEYEEAIRDSIKRRSFETSRDYSKRARKSPLKIAPNMGNPTPSAMANPPPKTPSRDHQMPKPTAPKTTNRITLSALMVSCLSALITAPVRAVQTHAPLLGRWRIPPAPKPLLSASEPHLRTDLL